MLRVLRKAFDPRRLILIPLTAGVSSIRVMSLVSLYHRSWNEIRYRNGQLLFVATLFKAGRFSGYGVF